MRDTMIISSKDIVGILRIIAKIPSEERERLVNRLQTVLKNEDNS